MFSLPEAIFGNENVGENDELSHDGSQCDLGAFSCRSKPLVVLVQLRVESGGGDAGHIEVGAHEGPSPSDMALACFVAAFAGDWRQAGQESSGFARALAEFGKADDKRRSCDRPHSGNGEEYVVSAFDGGIGLYAAANFEIEPFNMAGQRFQPIVQFGPEEGGLAGSPLVAQGGPVGDRSGAGADKFLQRFEVFGGRSQGSRIERLAHERKHSGVDGVGLGELTGGFGEQTRAQGIDDGDRQPCGVQASMGLPVILGRRLHDDKRHRERRKPPLEGAKTLGRIGDA